jgi:hypothetical protein
MHKNVLIWPSPWDYRLKDGLFKNGFSKRESFKRAYYLWQMMALEEGYELHTYDLMPIENGDVLWFINLPKTKREYDLIKKINPNAVTILQINESPLLAPLMFHEKNQEYFDVVVTYNNSIIENKKYFCYRLPSTVEIIGKNIPYDDRRHVCVINSNRVEGWFGMRQKGLVGLPGCGLIFSGWSWTIRDLFINATHGLYNRRRNLCREAENISGLEYDIYGYGWNGEQISWCPLYRNKRYTKFVKNRIENKLEVASQYRFNITFENYNGNKGYIDIKIFDAMMANSVPVYLGEERISEYVPEKCFVDARNFKNDQELLKYLKCCPESEWNEMREAGQAFIRSEKFYPFTDEAFAKKMVDILKTVCPIKT